MATIASTEILVSEPKADCPQLLQITTPLCILYFDIHVSPVSRQQTT